MSQLLGSAPAGRWRDRLSALGSSAAAALAHAPENAAYGLLALAPLGAAFGPQAMMLALLGAVVANAVASILGAGHLVSGPRASLALLTAGVVSALTARLDAAGVEPVGPMLMVVASGLVGAGLLQVLFGLFKLGSIVKFTPHPVRVGLTNGVGLLLMTTALPVLLGAGFGTALLDGLARPSTGALAIGACAMAVSFAAQRFGLALPVLWGLVAAALLQAALAAAAPGVALGPLLDTPAFGEHWLVHAGESAGVMWNRSTLTLLAGYALTVAALCSLDTLLAVSVVDGRLRRNRDANRELVAQGMANVAVAFAGGQPTSPSIPRSLALARPQGDRRHVVLFYTAALCALLLLAPRLLALLPVSAIGGVLLLQGAQMVSPALWRTPLELWRGRADPAQGGRLLAANWAIAAAVAANAIVLGLGPAVFIGASFAVLLFVRANMREVVSRVWTGATRRSLKMRPPAMAEALRAEGHRIVLMEIDGPLFFGTADALRVRLQSLDAGVDTVILDLQQVGEIDVTAARILAEIAEDFARAGRRLVLAEWDEADPRRRAVDAVAAPAQREALRFVRYTDAALEQAEGELLARLQVDGHAQRRALRLADTLLGRELDAAELALLEAEVEEVRFAGREVLFRIGDRGDALYVSVAGDIGLRIPGSTRRLASFAPGVTIGEMAVLVHGTRSAEAYAESEVVALRMSAQSFDRLMAERPQLAAKLLKNMLLHLSERLLIVTGDLAHWVSRAASGRAVQPVGGESARRGDAEAAE